MSAILSYPNIASAPADDGFARYSAQLGFDNPQWCVPRRRSVLSALEAASRLTPSQMRTMVRTQRAHLTVRERGRRVALGCESRAALGCLREEARLNGRLAALGQAWAGSHGLIALLTASQPVIVRDVLAGVVAGEVMCRVVDDVADRRVFGADDEQILREAWRAAYPLPAYFRRPNRT